ncbi:MAG: universal stress protein, partial [Euryarchaeota archaeon]|nr:universal stress protein [Euryarchaeota archaeon]
MSRAKEVMKKVYEEKPVEEEGHRILVPVRDLAGAKKIAQFASCIAEEKNAQVIFLNVLTLPEQTPFSAADRYIDEKRELIQELIASTDVPAGGIIKVGRTASDIILNTIEEEEPDMVLMGWRGRTFRRDFVLGSTIDPILLKAKCDVVMFRFEEGKDWDDIHKILVPTAGGPHA